MSKRLRASLRANNRGRSLRPRAGLGRSSAPPPESAPEPVVSSPVGDRVTVPEVPASLHATAPPPPEDLPSREEEIEEAPVGPTVIEPAIARSRATANITLSLRDDPVSPAPKAELEPAVDADEAPTSEPPRNEEQVAKPKTLDEELDTSSVSAAFFRADEDSLPPMVEAPHEVYVDDRAPAPVLSPETAARRARLRRVVAGVVAFASVISLAVIGKSIAAPRRQATAAAAPRAKAAERPEAPKAAAALIAAPEAKAAESAKAAEPAKVEDEKAAEPKDAKAEASAEEATKSAEAKKGDDEKPADVEKAEEPAKEEAKKAPSGGDASALKKETLSLLNRGKNKEAIEKAREAIAADPSDALPYLYLGSALQDSGKWKEGLEAYSSCVRTATKGPVHECRAMGGRK
jgi:hypothetical protein